MKQVSQLDFDGVFLGATMAQESPAEAGVFLLPAGAVDVSPPEVPPGYRARWADGQWAFEILPDPPAYSEPGSALGNGGVGPGAVSAMAALLAIDEFGLANAYTAWVNDPARTFAERAFVDKAMTWRRDNAVLLAAADALGLTNEQMDAIFMRAMELEKVI